MSIVRHTPLILVALALWLAAPTTAFADGNDVIRDCNEDGDLDRNYSDAELREADENLPADIDEYTDCRDVIRTALTGRGSGGNDAGGGAGFGGGPPGWSGSAEQFATPQDRAALEEATRDRGRGARERAAVTIDGAPVVPGGDGTFRAARTAANQLPLSVLLVLIGVAALAAALALTAAARRWPRLFSAPRRLLRR
jgi:hypothetical protein